MVQIMACFLFSAKPLSKPMLPYCQLDPKRQFTVDFIWNSQVYIQGNVHEIVVCEMAPILYQLQYVQRKVEILEAHSIT